MQGEPLRSMSEDFVEARQEMAGNCQTAQSPTKPGVTEYVMTMMPESEDRVAQSDQSCHHAEPVEIWKARRLILEQSSEALSLGKVAKAVNINANYLSEKFKQVTGIKFVDYIARIRFEKARDLLQDANLRVSEIAFAVGFQSLSQFNRVFKRFTGQSPTEYRASHGRAASNSSR
jgi:AraC-like DNA-binding protein